MKTFLNQAIIILLSTAAIGLTFNHFNRHGLPLVPDQPAVSSEHKAIPDTQGNKRSKKELSLDEAYTLFKTNSALFVDARAEFFYKASHIHDAISIFFRTAEDNPRLKEMAKDKTLVTYCGGNRCDQAHQLLEKLEDAGFTNVFIFSGGMDEWRAAGYPIDEDKKKN
jgi:rhodanese-related sulfurtransferase